MEGAEMTHIPKPGGQFNIIKKGPKKCPTVDLLHMWELLGLGRIKVSNFKKKELKKGPKKGLKRGLKEGYKKN